MEVVFSEDEMRRPTLNAGSWKPSLKSTILKLIS